jgi:hypothetical protein
MLILEKIFRGKELTLCNDTAILNKWSISRPRTEIPIRTARFLIDCDILVLDSGNWETNEHHYVYNDSLFGLEIKITQNEVLEDLKQIIRETKLNLLNV